MVVLDSLVVVTALPRMQHDLHADLASLQWTVNSYGIAFAAGIITAAALGDRFGRRRVFNLGLALFTAVLGRVRAGPRRRRADRGAHGAGPRRRRRPAAEPDDPDHRVPAAAARPDRRHLRRAGRAGRRGRPARRRRGHREPRLALDLLAQRPDRPGRRAARRPGCCRRATARRSGSISPASPCVTAGVVALVWALVRANDVGWSSPEIRRHAAGRMRAAAGVRRLGARGPPRRWCRCGCSAAGPSPSAT